jgi:hypothetical protein
MFTSLCDNIIIESTFMFHLHDHLNVTFCIENIELWKYKTLDI